MRNPGPSAGGGDTVKLLLLLLLLLLLAIPLLDSTLSRRRPGGRIERVSCGTAQNDPKMAESEGRWFFARRGGHGAVTERWRRRGMSCRERSA